MTTNELPVNFRFQETRCLLGWLSAGDSCQVIGIGSVGKSNFLRHIGHTEVVRAILREAGESYLFVYLDASKMIEPSAWGFYELLLHQLLIELTNRGADNQAQTEIDELYQRLISADNRPFAIRYLERSLVLVCNRMQYRLVLLLDDLHLLIETLPRAVFAALRALRDEFKYSLMYVGATRRTLVELGEDPADLEPFAELLAPNTLWLCTYTDADARIMIERLAERHKHEPAESTVMAILALSGGHPGLLQAVYKNLAQDPDATPWTIQAASAVQEECRRIWDSIPPHQQQAMLALATNPNFQFPEEDFATLKRMGLWSGESGPGGRIFSLIFRDFLVTMQPFAGAHIMIDPSRRIVWVDGRKTSQLTPLEFAMLAYLVQHRGMVCPRDDLARHIYPEDMSLEGEGVTENRLDSVAKRLRIKIEQNPKNPAYIQTIRGVGFQLIDGEPEA